MSVPDSDENRVTECNTSVPWRKQEGDRFFMCNGLQQSGKIPLWCFLGGSVLKHHRTARLKCLFFADRVVQIGMSRHS